MSVVRAKYSGLILKESHDAMVEEVSGNMRIHCRQGIVEEIDFFVLSEKFRDVGIFEIKSLWYIHKDFQPDKQLLPKPHEPSVPRSALRHSHQSPSRHPKGAFEDPLKDLRQKKGNISN